MFRASCDDNKVILATSAVFGRMKIGRCIQEDAGFLGCQNDALPAVDSECSGRKRCEVIVSNKVFRRDVPGACMSALSGYARIAYTCADGKDVLHELIQHIKTLTVGIRYPTTRVHLC